MTTVNSLSGGKTSSYIAVHFPADIEMFSMVCIEDHNAAGGWLKNRPDLIRYANDKLEKYIPYYGEFIATAEDPVIIQTMMELEQKIGREITWVRGISFDKLIQSRNYLPNQAQRFCTTEMKLRPIFEYCYLYLQLPINMRLGYRFDESERKSKATTEFKFPYMCNTYGQGRQSHITIKWRENEFPLIDKDPTIHPQIVNYWKNENDVTFADDSNCQMCFWKDPQQKLINSKKHPSIMMWGAIQEEIIGAKMDNRMSLLNNFKIAEQLDFFSGGGSSCSAGFCTD